MKVLCQYRYGTLRPVDDIGRAELAKLGNDRPVTVEVKRARNPRFHRLYWALVGKVFENTDRYASADDLHAAIKIAAGLRTPIQLPDGTMGYIPGSIAFHKMSQSEFDAFYNRVCDLVAKHFLPGVTSEALKAEVAEMIGAAA